jgi:hypothetical protein
VDPDNAPFLYRHPDAPEGDYDFDREIFGLLQDFYYYNLETRHKETQWGFPRILSYRELEALGGPQVARTMGLGNQFYARAGWHFSYFGGADRIKKKITSFSHQEYNKPEIVDSSHIEKSIAGGHDLFDRDFISLGHVPIDSNDNLPENYELLLGLDG